METTPNLILHNANVLTLDPRKPRAGLVAINGSRIAWVGDDDRRSELEGAATRAIDCQGKTLLPGFNDAHCHILAFASSLLAVDCSPASAASIAHIRDSISRQAARQPAGTWIRAGGYDEFRLAEGRHPTRWDLDEAAPQHPVKLLHRSRHACVLNSVALSIVGITIESPEPPGGMIDRDLDSGEPNGVLFEMNSFLDSRVPPLTPDELEQGTRLANERYLCAGITSLQDATAHNRLDEWALLKGFKERGLLAPRLSVMVSLDALEELQDGGFPPRSGDDEVRLGALKAVLTEATGTMHPSQEQLDAGVARAHRAGYQVAIHAVEESTVAAAAQAIASALRVSPDGSHRHRIEHCSICPPELLERLQRIGAVVVTNPAFIYHSGQRYLATVAEAQQRWLYRIGSFLKSGLIVAAGSDSPIAPVEPVVGIYAAVTRAASSGDHVLPEEGISGLDAVRTYTSNAAYASFDEGAKGSITPGTLADLVLLSDDPSRVPPEGIKDVRVEMTVVGGRTVWER
ncbi:MAG: amidohydrolase [Chloroflexota bacterium]|nr:amidohydrolase [Chloroflexota bacterium]